jgi:hypothetical protein
VAGGIGFEVGTIWYTYYSIFPTKSRDPKQPCAFAKALNSKPGLSFGAASNLLPHVEFMNKNGYPTSLFPWMIDVHVAALEKKRKMQGSWWCSPNQSLQLLRVILTWAKHQHKWQRGSYKSRSRAA